MERAKIIVVTGPTASGKSAFALELAEALGGELVSADSMQVYRRLDIGTAKPSAQERARIRHHLIDVAEIDEVYSVGRFRQEADEAIRSIRSRGLVPVVVGGTALYLKALLQGLAAAPVRDEGVRGELEARWSAGEGPRLWEELRCVDPALAERLHARDRVRIVRGLEVWKTTGRPLSSLQERHRFSDRRYDSLVLGMEVERDALYRAIDQRVVRMLDAGWVEEVAGLLAMGYSADLPPLRAIGYREICELLRREGNLADTRAAIQRETRRLAKRQMTWFRRWDIRWVRSQHLRGCVTVAKNFLQITPAPI